MKPVCFMLIIVTVIESTFLNIYCSGVRILMLVALELWRGPHHVVRLYITPCRVQITLKKISGSDINN